MNVRSFLLSSPAKRKLSELCLVHTECTLFKEDKLGLSKAKLSSAGVELCFVYLAGGGLVKIRYTLSLRFEFD